MIYDPLSFPLEGIKMERYIEAAPRGLHQLLNIIKLIAARNLKQAEFPEYQGPQISYHPLMEESSYRFDIMTLTLTLACAEELIENDSLESILKSELWLRHNPGWQLFNDHFRFNWILSADQPLAEYILREPYESPLVALTRPPRIKRATPDSDKTSDPIRLGAGGGRLGFSVTKSRSGLLEVIAVDSTGLAHMNGIMAGDRIKRVNGEVVRNARELMAKILDGLDKEGIYMIIIRDGEEFGLLMFPEVDEY
jgi:hypothetical protein